MSTAVRIFEDTPAVRKQVPLLLGIVGCSGSGKTYSALRLAAGMQQVIGGDIFVIDTEHNRALNYADLFKFRHLPFEPPFGSLDYLRAIEHCYKKGGKIIVIDSMTHEHSGPGGYLDEAEQFLLDKIATEPENARKYRRPEKSEKDIRGSNSRTKWIIPADHRKKLTNGIVQMGINGIFCYRASEKLDDDFKPLGWEPETTSRLIYEMQQQFLLLPGSNGIPKFDEATANERKLIKTPEQFRNWFKQGQRIDEDMGAKMAVWASGVPESKITTEQAATMDKLMAEAKADPQRFWAYMGVKGTAEILSRDYQKAVTALESKKSKSSPAAGATAKGTGPEAPPLASGLEDIPSSSREQADVRPVSGRTDSAEATDAVTAVGQSKRTDGSASLSQADPLPQDSPSRTPETIQGTRGEAGSGLSSRSSHSQTKDSPSDTAFRLESHQKQTAEGDTGAEDSRRSAPTIDELRAEKAKPRLSTKQVRDLTTMAYQRGWNDASLIKALKTSYGVERLKDIAEDQYRALHNLIDCGGKL